MLCAGKKVAHGGWEMYGRIGEGYERQYHREGKSR
jgi:hypothetical protein